MSFLRALLVILTLGALASAEEVVWRKSNPGNAPVTLRRPDGTDAADPRPSAAGPAFRRVRAQSPDEEFTLPPEYWPSTLGNPTPKPLSTPIGSTPLMSVPPGTAKGAPSPPAAVAPTPATLAPAEFPVRPVSVNPITNLPWGTLWGQFTGEQVRVGDWIIPADGMYAPAQRLELRGEYLLWRTKGSTYPPLVTTDSPNTPEVVRGALPPTGNGVILFGGQQEDAREHSGARFGVTYWFGDCGTCAIEANYFFLGSESDRFNASAPVLARPFFDVVNNVEARQLVSSPGTAPGDVFSLRGAISVDAPSRLTGWDVGLRRCIRSADCWKIDGIIGYRNLDLDEAVNIVEDIVSLKAVPGSGGLLDPGNRIGVFDLFSTDNQFHGGFIGVRGEYRRNRIIVEGKARVSLGVTRQEVDINGGQLITRLDGSRQAFTGGLLAVASNIGNFSQRRFGVVPEVGIKVGYQVTDSLRAYVGYDFIYWNSVLRAGDQIDRRVNPFLVPGLIIPPQPVTGPILPRVPFKTSDYWAQGFNFGLEWRY